MTATMPQALPMTARLSALLAAVLATALLGAAIDGTSAELRAEGLAQRAAAQLDVCQDSAQPGHGIGLVL